jgi:hypothetical protein
MTEMNAVARKVTTLEVEVAALKKKLTPAAKPAPAPVLAPVAVVPPLPTTTVVGSNPAVILPAAMPPLEPPLVAVPLQPDSMAHVINVSNVIASVDVGTNTILRITPTGYVGVVIIRPGSVAIRVEGGTVGRFEWGVPGTAGERTSDVTISGVLCNANDEYCIKVYGDRVRIENSTFNTRTQYAAWVGSEAVVRDVAIVNCNMNSVEGGQSTVRCTDVLGLQIDACSISNVNRHCLRVHGASSNVSITNTRLIGGGNGLAMGAMGPQVPGSVNHVYIRGLAIQVGGEDALHLERDGSLTFLTVDELTLHPNATIGLEPKWDLVGEYTSAHPSTWSLNGLRWA